jgi:hypothetical protein
MPRRCASRPADRDPGQDHEGLTAWASRPGAHDHASAEEARCDDLRAFRDRFGIPLTRPRSRQLRSTSPADDSPEMRYLHARRAALGGCLPRRQCAVDAALPVPRLDRWAVRAGGGGQGDVDHDGGRAHARQPAEGRRARSAHRAHRRRRGAHLRHGQPVPPGRHLRAARPAVRARGPGLDAVLPRGTQRPDPRGRHLGGGRDQFLDRRGDQLQRARPADAAVLHLLLDVRLSARRRPDLGRGRPARARFPARRHQRSHHLRARACSIRTAARR